MLQVGVIGYRNHARRLINIIDRSSFGRVGAIYHPTKKIDLLGATQKIDDLLGMDAVFVASPNDTHFSYLSFFAERFDGYVFCEKPPVATPSELRRLRLDPRRVYFNFNYRRSRFADSVVRGLEGGMLGTPLFIDVVMTQGLAFKSEYVSSWRSDASRHRYGIAETKAIHYLDLAIMFLGSVCSFSYRPRIASGHGTSFDTCQICTEHEGGGTATIFTSYAAPLRSAITAIGTNGVVEFRDECIRTFGPRDTFDERGYFVAPPCVEEYSYAGKNVDMYSESLENSVEYFLSICAGGGEFPADEYFRSLEANRVLFELSGIEGDTTLAV